MLHLFLKALAHEVLVSCKVSTTEIKGPKAKIYENSQSFSLGCLLQIKLDFVTTTGFFLESTVVYTY